MEAELAATKKAMEGDDTDKIKAAADKLRHAGHKMAEAIYSAAAAGGPQGGPQEPTGGAAPGGAAGGQGNVVDAEFEDLKT